MSKHVYIVVAILLVSSSAINGQQAKSKAPSTSSLTLDYGYSEIQAKAKATADALVRGDFNTIAVYTYPKLVRLMGGHKNVISVAAQEMRDLERKGFTVKSVTVGEPNKVEIIGKQIFSIVPMTMIMTMPGGTMMGESFLIAVSEDGSKTWTFVDGAIAADKRMLRQLFPFAANKLQLPPKKRPVFYRNDGSRG